MEAFPLSTLTSLSAVLFPYHWFDSKCTDLYVEILFRVCNFDSCQYALMVHPAMGCEGHGPPEIFVFNEKAK